MWGGPSWFVQVTVVPTATVRFLGPKANPTIVTAAPVGVGGAVVVVVGLGGAGAVVVGLGGAGAVVVGLGGAVVVGLGGVVVVDLGEVVVVPPSPVVLVVAPEVGVVPPEIGVVSSNTVVVVVTWPTVVGVGTVALVEEVVVAAVSRSVESVESERTTFWTNHQVGIDSRTIATPTTAITSQVDTPASP